MAVMMQPRENWTDERLDDLQGETHRGFADLKAEIAETRSDLKAEIAETKAEMRTGFARVDTDIRELRGELNSMNRNMIAGFFVIVAAIIGSNAALIASGAL